MAEPAKHIEAFDCLPFNKEEVSADVLQSFMQSQQKSIFWFSATHKPDEECKLAEYDYRNNCWVAGRFIGEAIIHHKETDYKITIKPRFGEKVLLKMLEEIFNIRITTSASQSAKTLDWQHYIKRIIAFIWLQKLANANLHGVPRVQVTKEHKGQTIRGRLNTRKTVQSLYRNNEAVSFNREKHIDKTIAQIIFQAYKILQKDFLSGAVSIPDTAQDAINQIHNEVTVAKHLTENEYRNIKYKDIYLSWKPVVDLSWDIIKRKQLSLKQEKAKSGFGFFIDMAEVWEQYLRAVLKKHLLPFGWHYRNEKQIAYKGYFFQRELIPDLIFQRNNEVAVWDAKYKRMTGMYYDIDRSDFFQIHTYIQYQLKHKEIKAGGLLYPISTSPDFEKYQSKYLINEEGFPMNFSIDGIELAEKKGNENFKKTETDFIKRIIKSIS